MKGNKDLKHKGSKDTLGPTLPPRGLLRFFLAKLTTRPDRRATPTLLLLFTLHLSFAAARYIATIATS